MEEIRFLLSLDIGCARRKDFDVNVNRDMRGTGFFVNLRRRCLRCPREVEVAGMNVKERP